MADIVYWSDEYSKNIHELEKLVDASKTIVGDMKSNGTDACDAQVTRLKEIKKSFGLELRMIKDKSLKLQYDAKAKEYDAIFNDLIKEIANVKARNDKQELKIAAPRSAISTEGKSNEELLESGVKIQENTMESLERTKGYFT